MRILNKRPCPPQRAVRAAALLYVASSAFRNGGGGGASFAHAREEEFYPWGWGRKEGGGANRSFGYAREEGSETPWRYQRQRQDGNLSSSSPSAGSISGYVFFDLDSDGEFDSLCDWEVRIERCVATDEAAVVVFETTTTLGSYSFLDLEAGQYRLTVVEIPDSCDSFYLGDRWEGLDDDEISNGSNNANANANGDPVDPATGTSPCMALEEGEEKTVNYRVKIGVPGPRPAASTEPAFDPTQRRSDASSSLRGSTSARMMSPSDTPPPLLLRQSDVSPTPPPTSGRTWRPSTAPTDAPSSRPSSVPSLTPSSIPTISDQQAVAARPLSVTPLPLLPRQATRPEPNPDCPQWVLDMLNPPTSPPVQIVAVRGKEDKNLTPIWIATAAGVGVVGLALGGLIVMRRRKRRSTRKLNGADNDNPSAGNAPNTNPQTSVATDFYPPSSVVTDSYPPSSVAPNVNPLTGGAHLVPANPAHNALYAPAARQQNPPRLNGGHNLDAIANAHANQLQAFTAAGNVDSSAVYDASRVQNTARNVDQLDVRDQMPQLMLNGMALLNNLVRGSQPTRSEVLRVQIQDSLDSALARRQVMANADIDTTRVDALIEGLESKLNELMLQLTGQSELIVEPESPEEIMSSWVLEI